MSDESRRVFVEIIVDESAALAKLANVDRGVVQIGKSAAQAKADFHALFDGGKITPAVDATKSVTAAQKQHEAAVKAVTERYAESNKHLLENTNLVRTLGRDLYQAGQFLTLAFTVPLVGAAAASLKFAMDFETNMVRLRTLSMVTAENMGFMKQAILELAPAVGIGPVKLSEALLQVTSTGIRGKEAMEILEVAAKGSAVGLGDVTTVAKTLTSVLAAYGAENITAAEAGNVLYKMVVEGKGELTEFAGSLGRVVGMAAMVGVSMADAGAFIATFTRTGGSAAEAVTALRNVLQRLEISSKSTTESALKQLGLSLAELREQIATKGLVPTLVDLIHTFGATNDVLGKLFPNVRGLAGVMTVAGAQSQSATEIFKHLSDNLKDELSPAFALTAETMQFRWNQIKAQFEAAAIALGEKLFPQLERVIPALERVIQTVVGLIDRFGRLSPWLQDATVLVFAFAAALGPLMIVMGGFSRVIGVVLDAMIFFNTRAEKAAIAALELAAATRTADAAMKGMATATTTAAANTGVASVAAKAAGGTFLGLTAPAWGVVAAIGALAYGIKELAGDWTSALLVMAPPLGMLKDSWDRTGSLIVEDLLGIAKSSVTLAWRALKEELDGIGQKIKFIADLIPGFSTLRDVGAVDTRGLRALNEGLKTAIRLQDEANKPIHYGVFAPETDATIRKTSLSMWDNMNASMAMGQAHLEGAQATNILTGSGLANAEQTASSAEAFASLAERSRQYRDELQALTATQRGQLTAALKEGVIGIQEISKATGVSVDALQLLQKQLQATGKDLKQTAQDSKQTFAHVQQTIKAFDSFYAKRDLFMAKEYADFLASMKKRLDAKQENLAKQAAVMAEYDEKERQLHLDGTALQVAQINEQERQFLASAAARFEGDAVLWQMQLAAAKRYFDTLRGMATGSSETLVERMAAAGVHTKVVLAQMAAQAQRDYEQMKKDGTAVWTSAQIEDARQKAVDATEKATGKMVFDVRKNLGQIGAALSAVFENISSGLGEAMQIIGNALEVMVDKSVSGTAKVVAGFAAAAQMAKAFGGEVASAALSGASAGAALGSVIPGIGTAIGAVVGGVAGLFAGLFGQSKKTEEAMKALRAEVQATQAELIKTYGSYEQLVEISEMLGISLAGDWTASRTSMEMFEVQVRAFEDALADLDARLVSVSESMGLLTLAEIERLQKLRIAGYNSEGMEAFTAGQHANITAGAATLVSGFASPWLQMAEEMGTFAERTDQVSSKILDLQAKIADMDAKGGPATEQQARNYLKWSLEVDSLTVQLGQMIEAHRTGQIEIDAFVENGQAEFDRFGRILSGAFAAAVAGGAGFLGALRELGPSFQQMTEMMEQFGFKADSTLQTLLGWSAFTQQNPELVASIDALNQMMTGLWNTGMLNEQMFQDLSATAYDVFQRMTEQGRGGEQGMRAMQPTLQSIWQIWKDTGWVIDDNTLKLIQNAEEAGIVGEKFKDPARKQVEALEAIQTVLGDLTKFFREDFVQAIYDAFDAAGQRAADLGTEIDTAIGRERRVPIVFDRADPIPSGEGTDGGGRMHTGGIVGGGPPWLWAEAPRAHNGLAVDEVPIIAQRGERVLSRADTALLERRGGLPALRTSTGRGGDAPVSVTVTINRPMLRDAQAIRELAREVEVALNRSLRNRGVRQGAQ